MESEVLAMAKTSDSDFINLIIPDFGALTNPTVATVTPVLVIIIWAITIGALGYAAYEALSARRQIERIAEFYGQLGKRPIAASERNREFPQQTSKDKVPARLWEDFSETLLEQDNQLFSTQKSEDFYNEYRLAPKLVANRLLSITPIGLITLGLLGTFIGLTVGLRSVDLNATSGEMQEGIQALVKGAALGFTASLWGIATSLLTNLILRICERSVTRRVQQLQTDIDKRFALRAPEHTLVSIATDMNESRQALQVLHEKIGSALQEAVQTVSADTSSAVQEAIANTLNPAMEALTEQAMGQSASVFKEVSSQLTESFHAIGITLASELKASASSMRETLDEIGARLESYTDHQLNEMERLHTAAQIQFEALSQATDRQLALVNEALPVIAESLRETGEHVNATAGMMDVISNELGESAIVLEKASNGLAEALPYAAETLTNMGSQINAKLEGVAAAQEVHREMIDGALVAAQAVGIAVQTFNERFEGITRAQNEFLSSLESRLLKHTEVINGWLATYSDEISKQTMSRMDEWNKHTLAFTSQMMTATDALSSVIDELTPQTVSDERGVGV